MTFLASIYLWLLPLVSIPIIFHLLKKRNYKDIKFSSLIFFNVIEDSTLKRNNLINILLLIIRTVILLLIILIISKPTIDGVTRNKNNSYDDVCIIILDNSFSNSIQMEQSYNKIVNKITAVYDDNTLIKIANMSDNIFMVNNFKKNITSFNIDNQILYSTSSLENISILFDNTDYSNYNNKDFYLISDMQENIFNNKIDFIDDTWNKFLYKNDTYEGIYFSSLNIKPDFISIDEPLSISVRLNNSTKNPIESSEIALFIDDINVGFNKISIDVLQSEVYTFTTSINSYGYHKCYFKYDDIKYFFIIDIPPQINIAIIDENFNSKYLSNALLAFNEMSGNINYSIFTLEEYRSINNAYDSVILFGLQHLDSKLLNKISRQTNNAVAVPADSFNLDSIHKFFSLDNLSQAAKPELIKEGYINLNNFMTTDNSLKSILNNETIEFYKYYKINKTNDTISEYENTHAFINRYTNEYLSLTLITSPLDINSNNLPLTSIFMPLINDLFLKDIKEVNYMVGDSIEPTMFSTSINLQFIENKIISNYKTKNIKAGDLVISNPGFHELVFDNSSSNISANVPLIEFSDSIADTSTLDESLKNYIMINNIDELSDVLNTQVNGFHLWRYFLWMLVLFIIIEMIISNIYVYKND